MEEKIINLLLELKSQTEQILSYIKDSNFKYNLLIDKVNKLSLNQKNDIPPQQKEEQLNDDNFIFPKYEENLKDKIKKKIEQLSPKNTHLNNDKLIPVQQKIVYENGSNVYMAAVNIYDEDKNLIKQNLKTNHVGKWIVSLNPGKYLIEITKEASAARQKLHCEYEIDVPNQDFILELENQVLS